MNLILSAPKSLSDDLFDSLWAGGWGDDGGNGALTLSSYSTEYETLKKQENNMKHCESVLPG